MLLLTQTQTSNRRRTSEKHAQRHDTERVRHVARAPDGFPRLEKTIKGKKAMREAEKRFQFLSASAHSKQLVKKKVR
jgi:hypothetical protein